LKGDRVERSTWESSRRRERNRAGALVLGENAGRWLHLTVTSASPVLIVSHTKQEAEYLDSFAEKSSCDHRYKARDAMHCSCCIATFDFGMV
jgi:hypothetical protein